MIRFEPQNDCTAWLYLEGASPFGRESVGRLHRLGLRQAPRYTLEEPAPGDAGWLVHLHPEGETVAEGELKHPELTRWIEGTRAWRGRRVLEQLPPGRYLLVRSSLRAEAASTIALGSDYMDATPNLRLLAAGHPNVYACVVGSRVDRKPALDQPLVAAVVLSWGQGPSQHGALFFSFSAPEPEDERDTRDLLLVIPASGEAVVDALSSHQTRSHWDEYAAADFAAACTGRS